MEVGKCYEFFYSKEQATLTGRITEANNDFIKIKLCGTNQILEVKMNLISELKEMGCTNCL